MENITLFLTATIPATLVLFAMYLAMKSFLDKEAKIKMIDKKLNVQETVLPIRLQAYERMCLFLERISPNNLVLRVNDASFTSAHLHAILLQEIREEFTHNYAQQMYLSDTAWSAVKQAVESLTMLINDASSRISGENTSIDLARAIFERMAQEKIDPVYAALAIVKNEARQLFD